MISPSPEVTAIVVSYNTRAMTLQCLQTLFGCSGDVALEVIVVDNDSRDGTVEAIRAQFPDVQIIASEENLGFGRANNCAMKIARAPRFLLLNSDAFVHDGATKSLIEYSKSHPQVGVVGPRLLNRDGSVQQSAYAFPTPWRAWSENLGLSRFLTHGENLESRAPWLVGACLLVKREVWQGVGGFDERFFMYQEETDWQKRIRAAGWEIALEPRAVVSHWSGASNASDDSSDEKIEDKALKVSPYFFDSLDLYSRKHHGLRGLILLRVAMVAGNAFRLAAWLGLSALPSRRKKSRARAQFHGRLLWRQATLWKPYLRRANVEAKVSPRDKNAGS